jgi:hypothetical protein
MPANARFEFNEAGWRAALASADMQKAMLGKAEKVAARAQATAPVVTGRYRASIRAEARVIDGKAVGRVTASVPYALFVEYGTRTGSPRQRILGNALDAAKD